MKKALSNLVLLSIIIKSSNLPDQLFQEHLIYSVLLGSV